VGGWLVGRLTLNNDAFELVSRTGSVAVDPTTVQPDMLLWPLLVTQWQVGGEASGRFRPPSLHSPSVPTLGCVR
jgi:hypothetical protein